ncbi:uncharacterized protein LOC124265249 isoform X2 [Haliotis rubra]|uniref:uncharacterized protein LOC124265249 isoform X2 n=1 Tax=Haliotis rubra TaxID=36100 RepID=UPI001EE5217F|nr:uncharacterized protein LOC124265249 isoform X2 [Haliotis rubra]
MACRKESLLFVFAIAAFCGLTNAGNGGSAGTEISRLFVTKDSHEVLELKQPNGTGCGCVGYTCGCCAHLEVKKIGLNDTVCTNLTYLPDEYGVSLTLSVDGIVYFKKTISARNPPPICVGLPYLKKEASLCVKFYNLSIQQHTFSGCVDVVAKLVSVVVESFKLGCFKIPPRGSPVLAMSGTKNIQDGQQDRFDVAEEKKLLTQHSGSLGSGCSCLYYDCGCCAHMELDTIGLNNTVCGNLTFEPKQSIVDISLSVDKKVYINKTVSGTSPGITGSGYHDCCQTKHTQLMIGVRSKTKGSSSYLSDVLMLHVIW